MGDKLGLEPGFPGEAGGGEGVVVGEGVRGCAEWAMSFSGYLKQGMTTVKVGESVCERFIVVRGGLFVSGGLFAGWGEKGAAFVSLTHLSLNFYAVGFLSLFRP